MKNNYNTIKKVMLAAGLLFGVVNAKAQVTVINFETFTLSPNSAYSPSATVAFQTPDVTFQHKYAGYWSGGFVYTNVTNSTTAGYTNMYGVRAYTGYSNSATYAVGQDKGVIQVTAPQATVNGFYVTNTTYAYLSMSLGDQFARKFGDTLGTGSGTTIAQGSYPDYFKLIVRGYKNGTLKADSATVMLADFTFTNNTQDYILNTWQFVNTTILGEVDSLKFSMRSTDVGSNGINTPLYFAIDNFTIQKPVQNPVGIADNVLHKGISIYPNPFSSQLNIHIPALAETKVNVSVFDMSGRVLRTQELSGDKTTLDLQDLQNGMYIVELRSGSEKTVAHIIKN